MAETTLSVCRDRMIQARKCLQKALQRTQRPVPEIAGLTSQYVESVADLRNTIVKLLRRPRISARHASGALNVAIVCRRRTPPKRR